METWPDFIKIASWIWIEIERLIDWRIIGKDKIIQHGTIENGGWINIWIRIRVCYIEWYPIIDKFIEWLSNLFAIINHNKRIINCGSIITNIGIPIKITLTIINYWLIIIDASYSIDINE